MTASRSHAGPLAELRRYWRGEGPLWKLYWLYGVLLSTLGATALVALVLQGALPVVLLVPLLGLALAYTLFILVAIWRCAFNIAGTPLGIDREAWGWLARLLTFGWAANAAGGSLLLLQVALGY